MKTKIPVLLLVLAALAVVIFIVTGKPKADQAYANFSQVMDHFVGADNWSAAGYDPEIKNGLLVVNGLSVNMQPKFDCKLVAEKLGVKNLIKSSDLALLTPDWRGQKDLTLAEYLRFNTVQMLNLKQGSPETEGAASPEATPTNLELDELTLDQVLLKAAAPEAPAGAAGYLKALHIAGLNYNNFVMEQAKADKKFSFKVGYLNIEKMHFQGQEIAGLEKIDPSGVLTAFSAFSSKSSLTKDILFHGKDPEMEMTIELASGSSKDQTSYTAMGLLKYEGLKMKINIEDVPPMTANLARTEIKGLDFGPYIAKFLPAMVLASKDPAQAEQLINSTQTLADILVSPLNLDEATIEGFEFNLPEFMVFKIDKAHTIGDFRAGKIPTAVKNKVSGVEFILGDDNESSADSPWRDKTEKLREFTKKFGMSRFALDLESESSYDPISGHLQSRLNRFEIKDLAHLTGLIEIDKLTEQRIDKFKDIPMATAYMALLAPEAVFGDIAFKSFNLKLKDLGLTDRVFLVLSQREETRNVTPQEMKEMAAVGAKLLMDLRGREYLANPEILGQSLADFLRNPGTLELTVTPNPPLSVQSALEFSDHNKLLNSLNIMVNANGQNNPPLAFNLPGVGGGQSQSTE